MRLLVMLVPGTPDPLPPDFAQGTTRVANRLSVHVNEPDVTRGIKWAQSLMAQGLAEEYALGATSLEDAYIRLTGDNCEEEL
jgi:ABC-2 type transport system ATP-binding protein